MPIIIIIVQSLEDYYFRDNLAHTFSIWRGTWSEKLFGKSRQKNVYPVAIFPLLEKPREELSQDNCWDSNFSSLRSESCGNYHGTATFDLNIFDGVISFNYRKQWFKHFNSLWMNISTRASGPRYFILPSAQRDEANIFFSISILLGRSTLPNGNLCPA